jgi:DNA-binding beta-propeller fold protein YncE
MRRREFLSMAAAPVALAFLPDGCRQMAGRVSAGGGSGPGRQRQATLAFVTADLESHVAVASSVDGRVLHRIATREGPRSIEAAPGQALVAHMEFGAVTILDTGAMEVRRVLEGLGAPAYTAISPDKRYAYVSDSGKGEVAVIDLQRGRIVGGGSVGTEARHLSISPDGRTLWIALGMEAPEVVVVDLDEPERPRVSGRLELPFLAHDVVCAPDGRRLWVTSGVEPRMALYRPGRSAPLKTVDADAAPQHVSFGPGRAYVASGEDGSLVSYAPLNAAVLGRDRLPIGSYNLSRHGPLVVSPSLDQGTVSIADRGGRVLFSRRIAESSHDACLV